MPVMDGFEFCSERQKDRSLLPIPVLLVSALRADDPRFTGAQATGYLSKPFCPDALIEAVANCCARPHPAHGTHGSASDATAGAGDDHEMLAS